MDIAAWKGLAFRRWLRSADRLSESAILCGSVSVKTFCSKSSALLFRLTPADHLVGGLALISPSVAFEILDFALVALGRPKGVKGA